MFDLLTVGNATQDIFMFPEKAEVELGHNKAHPFPELCFVHGSKITVERMEERIGGNAANVAVGAARLGLAVATSVYIGADDWGDRILATLKKEGVETKYILRDTGSRTPFSVLLVYNAERTILQYHGVVDFDRQARLLPKKPVSRWIYLTSVAGDWETVYKDVVRLAAEGSVKIAFNPGVPQLDAGIEKLRGILHVTQFLVVNKEEAIQLTGLPPMTKKEELALELHRFGPPIVAVTDGPAGAVASDQTEIYHCPAFPGERIEPTGAGDSFATGVLSRLLLEPKTTEFLPSVIREALAWGAVNSASVVQTIGPQDGLLTKEELQKRLSRSRTFVVRSRKR